MSGEQKSYLLRLPKPILEAYQRWAEDELRSLNGQLEYVLRKALKEEGRLPKLEQKDHSEKDETKKKPKS
jgi:hypothetical protein